ncbi:hypothetical protein A9Q88_03700 [Gammaproteobacteria bacterium 50_400_T64]|nr:hypothetical protein A9Q88_03700 [Gammaproteobacteria bacterium 50_400_T64]
MRVSHQQKQRNSRIFFTIFGAFFFLPGLGLLFFKAIPNLPRLLSAKNLSGDEFESIVAAGIVGFLFSLFGGGLVYSGLKKPSNDVALLNGDSPWLGQKKWASATIKDSFILSGGLIWGFAIFWNLISTPALFAFSDELGKGNQLIWLVLLFPLVGLFLIGAAIHKTLDWRRFGQMKVTLEPYPGAIGGDVAGTVHLSTPLPAGTPVKVSLDCVRHYSSGKNSSQHIVWQHEGLFEPLQSSRSTTVQFLFEVPSDLPQSSPTASSYHAWKLRVSAEIPGVDLERQIDLPVFPTAAKASSSFRLNTKPLNNDSADSDDALALDSEHEQTIKGEYKSIGVGAGAFVGLVFSAIGIGLAYFIGYEKNETSLIGFGAIFGSIGFAIFYFSIHGYFRRHYLRLAKPILELRYKTLFGGKVVTLNYDEIAAVTTESRGSMNVGKKHYQFFNLGLQLKNGEALCIGDRFSRQQIEKTAEALAQRLDLKVIEK